MASRKRGRFGLILSILVLTALAFSYSWAWFHYSAKLEDAARANLAAFSSGGRQAECPGMQTGGFPVGLQMSCTGFTYSDPGKGVAIETGPVRSEAKIYDPLGISSSFDGPAVVALEGRPALRLDWRVLTADTRLARPLPKLVTLTAADIAASLENGGQPLLHAKTARLEASPKDNDLELALRFGGLTLAESLSSGIALPPLDGAAEIGIDNGIALMARPPKSLRGLSANVKQASLSSGEAAISVTGPVSVGQKGLLNARLAVTIQRPREIAALLGDALPQMRDQIETAFAALAMLGGNATLPLRIANGEASIGFIKIGKVPPLQ